MWPFKKKEKVIKKESRSRIDYDEVPTTFEVGKTNVLLTFADGHTMVKVIYGRVYQNNDYTGKTKPSEPIINSSWSEAINFISYNHSNETILNDNYGLQRESHIGNVVHAKVLDTYPHKEEYCIARLVTYEIDVP